MLMDPILKYLLFCGYTNIMKTKIINSYIMKNSEKKIQCKIIELTDDNN